MAVAPPLGSSSYRSGSCRCQSWSFRIPFVVHMYRRLQLRLGFHQVPRSSLRISSTSQGTVAYPESFCYPKFLPPNFSSPSTILGVAVGWLVPGADHWRRRARAETGKVQCFWMVAIISSSYAWVPIVRIDAVGAVILVWQDARYASSFRLCTHTKEGVRVWR